MTLSLSQSLIIINYGQYQQKRYASVNRKESTPYQDWQWNSSFRHHNFCPFQLSEWTSILHAESFMLLFNVNLCLTIRLFGVLILLTEFSPYIFENFILTVFPFLERHSGRGVFYSILGSMCLDPDMGIVMQASGFALMIGGVCYVVAFFALNQSKWTVIKVIIILGMTGKRRKSPVSKVKASSPLKRSPGKISPSNKSKSLTPTRAKNSTPAKI